MKFDEVGNELILLGLVWTLSKHIIMVVTHYYFMTYTLSENVIYHMRYIHLVFTAAAFKEQFDNFKTCHPHTLIKISSLCVQV